MKSSLIDQVTQTKADCIIEFNNKIDKTTETINTLEAKIKITSNNVTTVRSEMVNVFVDIHNAVNSNQITDDHVKSIVNAKLKRDKSNSKLNEVNISKTTGKNNGGQ